MASALLGIVLLASGLALVASQASLRQTPWVIAHRGFSGDYPELTMLAFSQAAEQGADMLELDTAVTKDHQVIVLHEPDLSPTTDVKTKAEFASRLRTDTIFSDDGYEVNVTDYFTWDFNLTEVKQLRKHQRFGFRDASQNGRESVPTLREVLQLVKRLDAERQPGKRQVALLIEVKLCRYYSARTNQTKEELIANDLIAEQVQDRPDLVHLQTFELDCAAELKRRLPNLPVYKLEQSNGISSEKLADWRNRLRLDGIGVHKAMVANGSAGAGSPDFSYKYWARGPTDLVWRARQAGGRNFKVLVWTLRNEDRYIAWGFSQDASIEARFFAAEATVDGLITDFPLTVRRVVDSCCRFNGGSSVGAFPTTWLALLASVTALFAGKLVY